eukprot:3628055-Pyramimonas_sp.AAC.1
MVKHAIEIVESKKAEFVSLCELRCFKRHPRRRARNVVDTGWVLKWKHRDLKKFIKARPTMRGLKDMESNLATFARTASRWGQRVVDAVTVRQGDWASFSFDMSAAFAKGFTFEKLSQLTGGPLRMVQFELGREGAKLLEAIPGFETFNSREE